MSFAESVKADYRRELKEFVTVRRFTGTGSNRPVFDAQNIRARVFGYDAKELIGGIQQGDRKAILYADDVIESGLALPITDKDKLVVRGIELSIIAPDDSTRRVDGILIAYELQVRG